MIVVFPFALSHDDDHRSEEKNDDGREDTDDDADVLIVQTLRLMMVHLLFCLAVVFLGTWSTKRLVNCSTREEETKACTERDLVQFTTVQFTTVSNS